MDFGGVSVIQNPEFGYLKLRKKEKENIDKKKAKILGCAYQNTSENLRTNLHNKKFF